MITNNANNTNNTNNHGGKSARGIGEEVGECNPN